MQKRKENITQPTYKLLQKLRDISGFALICTLTATPLCILEMSKRKAAKFWSVRELN